MIKKGQFLKLRRYHKDVILRTVLDCLTLKESLKQDKITL